MSTARDPVTGDAPVERFKPTNGILLGYAGLACCLVAVAYVAGWEHTLAGLRVALGAVFAAVVIWTTQLRSRATAYSRTLLLRNALRDVSIPLRRVDEVSVRHTLNVWVGERRFVCIGIGSSSRGMARARRKAGAASLRDTSRWAEFSRDHPALEETGVTYEQFVVRRIEELAEQARRETTPDAPSGVDQPQLLLAWPEIAALAVTGLGFVVTLFL